MNLQANRKYGASRGFGRFSKVQQGLELGMIRVQDSFLGLGVKEAYGFGFMVQRFRLNVWDSSA